MSLDRKRIDAVKFLEKEGCVYKDWSWSKLEKTSPVPPASSAAAINKIDYYQKYIDCLLRLTELKTLFGKTLHSVVTNDPNLNATWKRFQDPFP